MATKKQVVISYTDLPNLSQKELNLALKTVKNEFERISNQSVKGMTSIQNKKRLKKLVKVIQLQGLLDGFKRV